MTIAILIGKMVPVGVDSTPEGFVAWMARISNPENQANHDTEPKLLAYLRRKKHWSPFDMVDAIMDIVTTRDVAHQILRHRSFHFQEFSQRYAIAPGSAAPGSAAPGSAEPTPPRLQDPKNRQNSIQLDRDNAANAILNAWWQGQQQYAIDTANTIYSQALRKGIAKEVARKVLPEGLTLTRLFMKGTLRSWVHYVQLRTGPETQLEHREVAQACQAELIKHFPGVFDVDD